MISYKYSIECKGILEEIFGFLSLEEKSYLLNLVREWSSEKLAKWFFDNEDELIEFCRATPSQRKSKKKWNQPLDQKVLLAYSAYQFLEEGLYVLKHLEDFRTNLSYRDQAVEAALFLQHVQEEKPTSFFAEEFEHQF